MHADELLGQAGEHARYLDELLESPAAMTADEPVYPGASMDDDEAQQAAIIEMAAWVAAQNRTVT